MRAVESNIDEGWVRLGFEEEMKRDGRIGLVIIQFTRGTVTKGKILMSTRWKKEEEKWGTGMVIKPNAGRGSGGLQS